MHCCHVIPKGFCHAHFETLDRGFLLDNDLKETYNAEGRGIVRGKSVALVFGNLLRVIAFSIVAIAKTVFLFLGPLFKPLFFVFRGLVRCRGWETIRKDIEEDFKKWPEAVKASVYSLGYTLFYGSLAEGGALVGVFDPYRGRKILGKAELCWSEKDRLFKQNVIMAPCFQARALHEASEEGLLCEF